MIAMIAKVISLRERSTSIRQILEEREELRYYLVRSITRGIEIFLAWILWRIYDFESLYVFMFPPIIYTVIDFCGQKIFTFKTDSLWTRKILGEFLRYLFVRIAMTTTILTAIDMLVERHGFSIWMAGACVGITSFLLSFFLYRFVFSSRLFVTKEKLGK